MENKKIVSNSKWLDDMTFVVYFKPTPTTEDFELEGVKEEVVVKFHKNDNDGFVDKIYIDADGGFIDHDVNAFTPYERAEYLAIAEDEYKKFNANDSWEEIVVSDNYKRYDTLVDSIKNYYVSISGNENVAYEIEYIISSRLIELLYELDCKFKKK